MKVHDLLERLTFSQLRSLAGAIGCTSDDPAALSEKVAASLASPAHWRQMLGRFSTAEQKALNLIASRIGSAGFGKQEEAIFLQDGFNLIELSQTLHSLKHKGVLFLLQRMWGETVWIMPDEIYRAFVLAVSDSPAVYRGGVKLTHQVAGGLDMDLLHLLSFIAKEKVVPLTKKGTVFKRLAGLWAQQLSRGGGGLEQMPWRLYHEAVYTKKLAFLLDILERLRLIRYHQSEIVLHDAYLRLWLSLDARRRNEILFEWWRSHYAQLTPQEARSLVLLDSCPAGEWIPLASLSPTEPEQIKKMLTLLCYLGWVELGLSETDQPLVRLAGFHPKTANEDKRAAFYVQPTFEVLLSPYTPLDRWWPVMLMGELRRVDQVITYELTRNSIEQALELGYSEPWILDFFAQEIGQLPDNVKMAVQQWCRNYGAAAFYEGVFMVFRDPNDAETFKVDHETARYVYAQISNSVYWIDKEGVKLLEQKLTQMGLAPRRGIQMVLNKAYSEEEDHPQGNADEFLPDSGEFRITGQLLLRQNRYF